MRILMNTEFISYSTSVSCNAVISELESAEWEADKAGDEKGDISLNGAIPEGKPHATPKETEQVDGAVVPEAEMVRYFERITVGGHSSILYSEPHNTEFKPTLLTRS